jgi:hypothetical protein
MRKPWASLAASAEFHEGIRTGPDGTIRKLFRITLPITRAASKTRPATVNLEWWCPQGLSYPSQKLPRITAIKSTRHQPLRILFALIRG